MKTNRWYAYQFATLSWALALFASTVRAEEFIEGQRFEQSLDQRVGDLEAEIAMLRRQSAAGLQAHESSAAYSACGGSCASCCGSCSNACCWNGPGLPCGWYVGGEFIYMEPRWKGFDAFSLTVSSASSSTTTTVAHEYDYDETFRLWAGYTGCSGLGVRASWWEFEEDTGPLTVDLPAGTLVQGSLITAAGINPPFSTSQSLELQTFDFEVTNCYDACGGSVVVAFGLRYVEFDVQTREQLQGVVLGEFSDSFEGVGPTLALDFVRPLCCSAWSLFANLRGTIAFGEDEQNTRILIIPTGFTIVRSRTADEPLAIAELQLALQYCCGRWFARGGYQAQYWDDVASDQASADAGAGSNTRSDLGLQGFFIAAGAQF